MDFIICVIIGGIIGWLIPVKKKDKNNESENEVETYWRCSRRIHQYLRYKRIGTEQGAAKWVKKSNSKLK